MRYLHLTIGLVVTVLMAPLPRRNERGLSQSTENAILVAGAMVIAAGVVTAVTVFVQSKLPK